MIKTLPYKCHQYKAMLFIGLQRVCN